jgi:hypothetical protein
VKKRIIYRKPLGEQDRFYISTVCRQTKNTRRDMELCEDMYLNSVNLGQVNGKNSYEYTVSCKGVTPEKIRMQVFRAILQGAVRIEYDSVYNDCITKDGKKGVLFNYIQDMNYRVTQIGRTMMALKNVGVYCAKDVIKSDSSFATIARPISKSKILAEQELPAGLAIGEFEDIEGNRYLFYQNVDCMDKNSKHFSLKLKKNYRVYRVNPHDGKQLISKESIDTQKILIMPGDADLLRYQDVEEEAFLIEYALKK